MIAILMGESFADQVNPREAINQVFENGIALLVPIACVPLSPVSPEFPTGIFVNENGDEAFRFIKDGTFSSMWDSLRLP